MYNLPDDGVIKNAFAEACRSLDIDYSKEDMEELVILSLIHI